jgi:HrpA-like RNA helicase
MGSDVGSVVGYRVRFDEKTSELTRIKFLTDGMLLREAILDRNLQAYQVIILDEAHERSVNSDVLMALLKSIVHAPGSTTKLVVMSATLDLLKLSSYFQSECKVVLEGRTFPIEIFNTAS